MSSNDSSLICKASAKASPLATRHLLKEIMINLAEDVPDQDELSTVEIVLSEALNNVVEHAYAPPTPLGPIEVEAHRAPNGLQVVISDHGREMPDGKAPIGTAPQIPTVKTDLPEGGFGWFLIQDLAHDVCYLRQGGLNRLSMRIAIAPKH